MNFGSNFNLPPDWKPIDDDSESMWDKEDEDFQVNHSHYTSRSTIYNNKNPNSTYSSSSSHSSNFNSSSYSNSHSMSPSYSLIKEPGCIGLANLGFTCYFNSSIQILSHIKPFVEYFLSNKYTNEINTNNPLGSGGVLVSSFATLVKKLWKNNCDYSYIHPSEFKRKLDQITTQFEGYEQHDSQEFLLSLLDGLHEDLNRIKEKPFVETTDFDGSISDQEASKIAWNWHLKRNDSVVVDWFQGQLKSKLICSHCKKMSIKYDPMMYLSLPIPQKDNKKFFSVVYSYSLNNINNFDNLYDQAEIDTSIEGNNIKKRRNIRYSVEVDKYATVADLQREFSALIKVSEENLIFAEVYDSRFVKFFAPSDNLESINETDVIYAYHVEKKEGQKISYSLHEKMDGYHYSSSGYDYHNSDEEEKQYQYLPVVFRRGETSSKYSRKINFSIPSILIIPKKLTFSELYQHIFTFIRPFIHSESHFYDNKNNDNNKDNNKDNNNDNNNKNEKENNSSYNKQSKSSFISQAYDPYYGSDYGSSYNSSLRPQYNDYSYGNNSYSKEEEFNYEQDVNSLFEFTLFDLFLRYEKTTLRESVYSDNQTLNIPDNCCLAVDWQKPFFDRYYNFSSEIDSHEDDENYKGAMGKDDEITIEKCLSFFTEEEGLKAENAWFCSQCNELRSASIQIDLWKLPPFLIIQLKRFGVDDVFQDREKIETKISFPLRNFDLSPFQRSSQLSSQSSSSSPPASLYDLVAVSNHSGTLMRGHYITYAKNCNDEKWYRYDDSMVTPISEDDVCTNNAYVLCYQRKDSFTWSSSFETLSYSLDDLPADEPIFNDKQNGRSNYDNNIIDDDIDRTPVMLYNLGDSNNSNGYHSLGDSNEDWESLNFPSSKDYSTTYKNYSESNWEDDILPASHDPLQSLLPIKNRNDDYGYDYDVSKYQAPTQQNLKNVNSIQDLINRKRQLNNDSEEEEEDDEFEEY